MIKLNQKINSNKTKYLLVESELKKLKIFHSSYFMGKIYFEEDGVQNFWHFNQCRNMF